MKESNLRFIEGLKRGLRSDPGNPTNNQFLHECFNMKPSPLGLVPHKPLKIGFSTDMDWPFPQLMIGAGLILFGTRSELYTVNDNWSVVKRADVTGSIFWSFADFDSFVLLSNGTEVVAYESGSWNVYTATNQSSQFPTAGTVCNFKGQAVFGDINPVWSGIGRRGLIWSDIGSVNCVPGLRNEAGCRAVPWNGQVFVVKRLGNAVMVYGDSGIGALVPYEQTFGWKEIKDGGIVWKGAVGGTDKKHLFLDNDNQIWLVKEDLEPELLGYSDYMDGLTNPVIAYRGDVDEFSISDADECYVLTKFGMGSCHQPLTSIGFKKGEAYGMINTVGDETIRIVTDRFDFGSRELKTVSFVTCDAKTAMDLYIAVDYRYDRSEDFVRSDWVYAGREGAAYFGITAVEFRICVKFARTEEPAVIADEAGSVIGVTLEDGTQISVEGEESQENYEDFYISALNVGYKFIDKRFTRAKREEI